MKFDQIDACAVARGVNKFPLFAAFLNFIKERFPSLPSNCPVKIGTYSALNVLVVNNPVNEFNMTQEDQKKHSMFFSSVIKSFSPSLLPNGVYRSILRLFNEDDKVGITLLWHVQLNHRLNDEEF